MDVNNPDDMEAMRRAIEALKNGAVAEPQVTPTPSLPAPTQAPVQDQQTMQQNAQPLIDALKRKHADDQLKGLFPSDSDK